MNEPTLKDLIEQALRQNPEHSTVNDPTGGRRYLDDLDDTLTDTDRSLIYIQQCDAMTLNYMLVGYKQRETQLKTLLDPYHLNTCSSNEIEKIDNEMVYVQKVLKIIKQMQLERSERK